MGYDLDECLRCYLFFRGVNNCDGNEYTVCLECLGRWYREADQMFVCPRTVDVVHCKQCWTEDCIICGEYVPTFEVTLCDTCLHYEQDTNNNLEAASKKSEKKKKKNKDEDKKKLAHFYLLCLPFYKSSF